MPSRKGLAVLTASALLFLPGMLFSAPVKVVAAENFYGDIVSQLGGSLVTVTSILSDPNVDPHEYETNVATAKLIASADLIVENSGGYDDWMDKLASASGKPRRLVKAYDLAPTKLPENEHVWYQPQNVRALAVALSAELKRLLPQDTAALDARLKAFLERLKTVDDKIAALKGKFFGVPVALTETIYLYQTGPLGLNVLTPFAFQKAVAEGDDPPAAQAVLAENQIRNGQVKALIFNTQTSTPATAKLLDLAKKASIPVVAVTETMPVGETYQSWMLKQLSALERALIR